MALQYKRGICLSCGEERMITKPSKKLCHSCNRKRLDEGKDKKVYRMPKSKPTGERILFQTIWNTRERVSFLTGQKLDTVPIFLFYNMFAHVLPKGLYPKFRLNENNIILLTPREHHLLDFGTEDQRSSYAEKHNCSWDKVYKLRDKLKLRYNEV